MLRYLLPVLIGAVLGSVLGYVGKCTTGTCPLTATPWRGALYGGFWGLAAALALGTTACGGASVVSSEHEIVGEAAFEKQVLGAGNLVLVDFYATWCPPCKKLSPLVDSLRNDNIAGLSIYAVDVDKNKDLAAKYGIQGIPCLILFRDGEEVMRRTGLMPKATLEAWVRKYL
jgi:thioredoxin 1